MSKRHKRNNLMKTAHRSFELARVALLALGLATLPVLNALATANHDDPFESHIIHAASAEYNHHAEDDHQALHNHDDHDAAPDESSTEHSFDGDLCCEDVGLCSVGLVMPKMDRTSCSIQISHFGLPGNSTPRLESFGCPDGPPPRSHG